MINKSEQCLSDHFIFSLLQNDKCLGK